MPRNALPEGQDVPYFPSRYPDQVFPASGEHGQLALDLGFSRHEEGNGCPVWSRGVEENVPEGDELDLHQRGHVTALKGGAEVRSGIGAPGACVQVGVLRG